MGTYGAAYAAIGAAVLFAGSDASQPWRFLLFVIGGLVLLAGAWTLLWFVGIESVLAADRSPVARSVLRVVLAFGIPVVSVVIVVWFGLRT